MELISYGTTGGAKGSCDAKCYDAKHPDCDCICGGRNHGVGLAQAIENTREIVEKELDSMKKEYKNVKVCTGLQLDLFE